MMTPPGGFPSYFLILERIRRIVDRYREFPVQRRTSRHDVLAAVEAAGPKAFGVGGINQTIVSHVPTEIEFVLVSRVSFTEIGGIEVDADVAFAPRHETTAVSKIGGAQF